MSRDSFPDVYSCIHSVLISIRWCTCNAPAIIHTDRRQIHVEYIAVFRICANSYLGGRGPFEYSWSYPWSASEYTYSNTYSACIRNADTYLASDTLRYKYSSCIRNVSWPIHRIRAEYMSNTIFDMYRPHFWYRTPPHPFLCVSNYSAIS